jgi:hypothetical protein
MLIKNFGHLWERKYINYGRGRVRGHLRGYLNRNQTVDFREQIGVYVLYDKDFIPVYVGQAGNGNATLLKRLNRHETDHLWNRWKSFSWFGVRGITAKGTLSKHDRINKIFSAHGSSLLNELEAILITGLEPKLNRQGARWKNVAEYFQEIDEIMDDISMFGIDERLATAETILNQIYKHIKKRA